MLAAAVPLFLASPASAQTRRQPAPKTQPVQATPAPRSVPASALAVPDQMSLAKLVWSTMAAVDQANKTGNYSVLRDLGSPGFQQNNNAASLAGIFAGIRDQRVDLSDTLVVAPSYDITPQMVQPTILRARGFFNMRPSAIFFDLLYEWNQGWRLEGIAVRALPMKQITPGR